MEITRESITKQYGVILTDNQWRILLDQLDDDDDDYSDEEIIEDVVTHIDEYEQMYSEWEDLLAKYAKK